MEQRVKGQETQISFLVDSVPQNSLVDVKSFEVALVLEILRESYTGETTDRRDDVFRGVRVRAELHFHDAQIFKFAQTIVSRARRRTSNVRISARTTLALPNGERPIIHIPQLFFGEIPINTASRTDYVSVTLDGEADDYRFIGLS